MANVEITSVEITNMVMIHDKTNNNVLVQNRRIHWKGIAFPGGHLDHDLNESIYDSAVREVKEETGLDVFDLKLCGIIHWKHKESRELIFYYKTDKYSGELIPETEEGENFWTDLDTIQELNLAPGFDKQIDLFFNDFSEYYISYDDDSQTYKWQ